MAWRLRRGATFRRHADGALVLGVEPDTAVRLTVPSQRVLDALMRLSAGATDGQLADTLGDDVKTMALLFHHLGRLRRHGFLVADVRSGSRHLATLLPCSADFDVGDSRVRGHRWQLSRFAYLRRDNGDLVLECTEAQCAVHVHSRALTSLIHQAVTPKTYKHGTDTAAVMALLATLGFLVDPDQDESAAQQTWEFHDRLFHRRGRLFDDIQPHGGTYRFNLEDGTKAGGHIASPPALRPTFDGEAFALSAPLKENSRPLLDVMESRRSRRAMGSQAVSVGQVAELLYRVGRTREVRESKPQDLLYRPYPSGGAIHELEFYIAVSRCDGLPAGFYHYRGAEHSLIRLPDADEAAEDMLSDCGKAWGQPGHPPHCLVVLSSRLPRLAWKYEAVAYKLSLLNAGVVLQSLYLVCTDMALNGSAVGSGRPDLFAAATGCSSWEETSIAEFGFGNPPRV